MANLQRLTERVKKMEDWIKENEMTGGPQGTLDTLVMMINEIKMSQEMNGRATQQLNNFRALAFEFIGQHELGEEWNVFLTEKEENNAVQEQSPEEVPSLKEAEDGEEVGEEDTEGDETSKEEESSEKKD